MGKRVDIRLGDLYTLFNMCEHHGRNKYEVVNEWYNDFKQQVNDMEYSNFIDKEKYDYPVDFFKGVYYFLKKEIQRYGAGFYLESLLIKLKNLFGFLYSEDQLVSRISISEWTLKEFSQLAEHIKDISNVAFMNEDCYRSSIGFIDEILSIIKEKDYRDLIKLSIREGISKNTFNEVMEAKVYDLLNGYKQLLEITEDQLQQVSYVSTYYKKKILDTEDFIKRITYRISDKPKREELLSVYRDIRKQNPVAVDYMDEVRNEAE